MPPGLPLCLQGENTDQIPADSCPTTLCPLLGHMPDSGVAIRLQGLLCLGGFLQSFSPLRCQQAPGFSEITQLLANCDSLVFSFHSYPLVVVQLATVVDHAWGMWWHQD